MRVFGEKIKQSKMLCTLEIRRRTVKRELRVPHTLRLEESDVFPNRGNLSTENDSRDEVDSKIRAIKKLINLLKNNEDSKLKAVWHYMTSALKIRSFMLNK